VFVEVEMKTTRVIVANRPRLLRELLLNTFSEENDIEVVAEVQRDSEISLAVSNTHPDCVIIGLENTQNPPPICVSLLRDQPNLKVIAIAADGNSLKVFWSEQHIRSKQIDASEAAILSALREETVPLARMQ
jgi:DNA-binding NarL/FixJ family response regulator